MNAQAMRSATRQEHRAPSTARHDGWAPSRTVLSLSILAGLLAVTAAVAGLVWQTDGATSSVTTLWGQRVELYGRGLYRHDSLLVAGNNFGSDIVTLTLALPTLAGALVWSHRGAARGRLLLLGALGYLVYYSASYALGAVAYNELFLVYAAMLSASLFAFVAAFASVNPQRLPLSDGMPRRWIGGFMIASGVVTLTIWMIDPITALVTGTPPGALETHTTLFTHAFDLAVIVPAAVVSGVLILRGRRLGYLIGASLLVLEALLAPIIAVATIAQLRIGVQFTTGVIVGPIAGFSTIAVLAVWALLTILRSVDGTEPSRPRN